MLDHDVDAEVAGVLRRLGHECWTAGDAGLATAADDDLTAYAQTRDAILVTHDREFSQRRRKSVIGRHLWLRCQEPDAGALLGEHVEDVVSVAQRHQDLWIMLSADGRLNFSWDWK